MLEVGPGLGILTRYLAERVAVVHAIELDRSLEQPLRSALEGRDNVRLLFGDALALDLSSLEPQPNKLVANLPYNIATPLRGGEPRRDSVARTLVRDGAARGRRAVLRRTANEGVRGRVRARAARDAQGRLSRSAADGVQAPAARRVGAGRVRAHRRPASRTESGRSCTPPSLTGERRSRTPSRSRVSQAARMPSSALAEIDRPPGARAEELAPQDFVRSRRRASMTELRAPAKLNLALVVGPLRPDGRHEVATVLQAIDLCDDIELEPADSLVVEGFAEDTIVRAALIRLAEAAGVTPGWRVRIEKRIPVAGGLGGGSSDAAAALDAGERVARDASSGRRAARARRAHGCGRAVLPERGPAARHRRRFRSPFRSTYRRTTWSCSCCPTARTRSRPRRSTAASTNETVRRVSRIAVRGSSRALDGADQLQGPGDAPAERPRLIASDRRLGEARCVPRRCDAAPALSCTGCSRLRKRPARGVLAREDADAAGSPDRSSTSHPR